MHKEEWGGGVERWGVDKWIGVDWEDGHSPVQAGLCPAVEDMELCGAYLRPIGTGVGDRKELHSYTERKFQL